MTLPQNLRWTLLSLGDHVLVACSGGPDSLSLLHVLWSERKERGLEWVAAAHLDHGLRGAESAAEAAWVEAWCAERGIPCHVGQANVGTLAREQKGSRQQAARAARYAFLEQVAAEIGATKIATAHTQDDQVETILLNILRGTGQDGLRGIPAERGLYVRPLLAVTRAEVEAYCTQYGLAPRRDPSNLSTATYTRNRVRLELLPQIQRDYNSGVPTALLRLSEIAARDSDYLHQQAEAALADVMRERDRFHLALDRAALAALHPALLRHVLRIGISSLRGTGEGITYDHMEAICQAVSDPQQGVSGLNLPHPPCTVRVAAETLTLTLPNVPAARTEFSVPLPVPGRATLTEIGWTVHASAEEVPGSVALDAASVRGDTLTLRNWRQGDRMAPLGMGGHHKKISDIFTDAKVPRAERPRIPIIADAEGILWVAGYAVADRAKVTPVTIRRLFLTMTRMEETQAGKQ